MAEWFADDALWVELYPFEFPESVFAMGEAQVANALRLIGLETGAVLDLGCGPGRHAIPLARRGFRVTAVDISRFHLGRARERAATAGVTIDFVEADMRTFVQPEAFDVALSLFTSFGYFEQGHDDLQVLRNVHRSLKPEGTMILDVMGKERLAKILESTTSERTADGALLVRRHEVVDDWSRVRNEWIIVKNGGARTFEFTVRVYSGQELKNLLHAAGFRRVKLCGSLDGNPYGPGAERLVAVAAK